MSPVRATFKRTVGRARSQLTLAFVVGAFLSAVAAVFAHALAAGDGGRLSLSVLWVTSVAPFLPVFASLVGMDVWSAERQSGRMDALLTVSVSEGDYVLGKFLGVFSIVMFAVLLSLSLSLGALHVCAPAALAGAGAASFALAVLALGLQGLLWSSVAVMTSAFFRQAATAAAASLLLTVALPRGIWVGLMAWAPSGRTAFGEMPFDAHVVDIASGVLPIGTTALYLVLTCLALYVAAISVSACRLVGRGASGRRALTGATILVAAVVGVLSAILFMRVNPTADLMETRVEDGLSARTRSILADTSGDISVTVFLSRRHVSFRSVSRTLRALKRESEAVGGAQLALRFVDPNWDVGAAERLVRRNIPTDSIVFEKGRRAVTVSVADGCGERVMASSVRRVSSPPYRRNVYWTVGHGETRFDDYGPFGMSDIARDLSHDGFGPAALELASVRKIPGDCALVVVAGARDDFSRAEADILGDYLKEGGRLLVLLSSPKTGGVVSMLPAWGVRPSSRPLPDGPTLSGTDRVVAEFSDHPVCAPLKGSRIVLESPVVLEPSAVAATGTGVDRIDFSPLAAVGDAAVVAAVERGGDLGADLSLRPTRLVVLGDAGFALNGQLASRGSANRDFFLNCAAYLSGAEAHGSGEEGADVFRSGLDRRGRLLLTAVGSVALPAVVFLILFAMALRRRNRS